MATVSHEAYLTEKSEIADVSRLHSEGDRMICRGQIQSTKIWIGGSDLLKEGTFLVPRRVQLFTKTMRSFRKSLHGYCPAGFKALGNNCYVILKVMGSYAEAQTHGSNPNDPDLTPPGKDIPGPWEPGVADLLQLGSGESRQFRRESTLS
ncbi:hypothetical protein DPMN_079083 [Dreissena polymorpha]|uniref:Uncharacterized protein n=1 Tax=Dreissena polymorpha TaxID=45954 RepID=A0A9D4BQT0_DREPO|nr:hypothetical protein DPMN_079083 [Dreissena polymorpha]